MEIKIVKKSGNLKVGSIKVVSQQVGDVLISRGIAVKIGDEPVKEDEGKIITSTVKIAEDTKPSEPSKRDLIEEKEKEFKAADDKNEKRRLRKELKELKGE